MRAALLGLLLACLLTGCQDGTAMATPSPPPPPPPVEPPPPQEFPFKAPMSTYKVLHRYPHDPTAFTQGLLMGPKEGQLWESTGLKGHSELRLVELATGKVIHSHKLGDEYFGEGLALDQGKLFWLTWQNKCGFTFDPKTFKQLGTFGYLNEGWGLTTDPQGKLIMSDGSSTLSWHDPKTFQEVGQQTVKDAGTPIAQLNELEWVEGKVYANVWQTQDVAIVAPETGEVTGWLDLRGLLSPAQQAHADVLNGIAYDAKHKHLWITGKLWPTLFEIEVVKGP